MSELNSTNIPGVFSIEPAPPKHPNKIIYAIGVERSGLSTITNLICKEGGFNFNNMITRVAKPIVISAVTNFSSQENKQVNLEKRIQQLLNYFNHSEGAEKPSRVNGFDEYFVFITRDVLSSAGVNEINQKSQLTNHISFFQGFYNLLYTEFIKSAFNQLHVPFEKMVITKKSFLENLFDFIKIPLNDKHIESHIKVLDDFLKREVKPKKVNPKLVVYEKSNAWEFTVQGLNISESYSLYLNDSIFKRDLPSTFVVNFSDSFLKKGLNKVELKKPKYQKDGVVRFFSQNQTYSKPIVFLHIPKTAGTSFRTTLEKGYKKGEYFPTLNDIRLNGGQYPALNNLWKKPINKIEKVRFIAGHYRRMAFQVLPQKPIFITFFRHPESRMISNLKHFKSYDQACASLTLQAVFEKKKDQLIHLQIKYIAKDQNQIDTLLTCNKPDFDLIAKKLLNEIEGVGIVEEMKESLLILNNKFGFNLKELPKRNKAIIDPEINAELIKLIQPYLERENWLYEIAKEVFDNRLKSINN